MKLIVMIPCLNEEETLPQVVKTIPRQIPGISSVEVMIIDDGSTDNTINVALEHGVDHIVRLKQHMGLAKAFQSGIDTCLELGADIIVNTDGDNQYPSQSIPELIEPIISGQADIVIGDRQTHLIKEFSPTKRLLEKAGSWVVRSLSGITEIRDAVSGFRAYSRYSASRIHLSNTFSYTTESVIQAGKSGLHIRSVNITTNPKTRPSRLYKHVSGFIMRTAAIIMRSYAMYEPLKLFSMLGAISFVFGIGLGSRYIYFVFAGEGDGHVQSLILGAILLGSGLLFASLGILADLISTNRKLLEELVWREKVSSKSPVLSPHIVTDNGHLNGAAPVSNGHITEGGHQPAGAASAENRDKQPIMAD
jgi:glycosyltransferase involved in cell wall biosynthesis